MAERLNDPGKIFWPDSELKFYVQDAIRFWNVLTCDNKQNYALSVNPSTVWYDLQTINGSPRQATLTDRDIYSRVTSLLLEPSSNVAAVVTIIHVEYRRYHVTEFLKLSHDSF